MTGPEESMNTPESAIVGVDFTPATLRLVLARLDGEILRQEEHPLPEVDDEAAWAWEVGGRISTLFAADGGQRYALGIAVACPGLVDPVAGRIEECFANEAWEGLNVVAALRRHIDAPIVALGRVEAALRGEASAGNAVGTFDALYVSLLDGPSASVLSSGRILGGAQHRAGGLPAFPDLKVARPLMGDDLQQATALLADLAALVDPSVIIVHGLPEHTDSLLPVLQRVLDEVLPGVEVAPAALGEKAALLGALRAAAIVAYEGERADDQS